MEFLKAILGDELYAQLVSKINEHNGNEANKDNQIKIGNLGSGEFVSKLKYDDIVSQLTGKNTELENANGLIAELKKGTKGNEEMQQKISDYDAQVAQLQTELQETKVNSALKVKLLEAKADDVDYLTYKLQEKMKEQGKTLELDENENIKGWDDMLSGLQTQFPTQFKSEANGKKEYDVDHLPGNNDGNATVTKEQFNKMGYNSRVELKNNNPELYAKLTN